MHLEEFIERLEHGLGDGVEYRLNWPENKIEFVIDEDPTNTIFEVTLEVVGRMRAEEFPDLVERLFENTIARLRAKAREFNRKVRNGQQEEEKS